MGKKLAIRGHSTRGNEVIELLKMMGGSNIYNLLGNNSYVYYTNDVCQNIIRGSKDMFDNFDDDTLFFTLEEFLNKYPYKIGDKVTDLKTDKMAEVYKIHWSENNGCVYYDIKYPNNCGCQRRLMDLKPVEDNTKPSKMKNVLAELIEHIKTTPKEELDKELKEIEEWSDVGLTVEEFMAFCNSVNKKHKYPTTYEECCGEDNTDLHFIYVDKDERDLYQSFIQLIRCRNAYWKIAGEELGLDKPWEPDWNDHNQPKFGIHTVQYNIRPIALHVLKNLILVFPTEEIRDIFYENFKDLIEQCKELL